MRLNNKFMKWDEWAIYNPYSKCTKQLNNYDCGSFVIKFIDLDTLGESLLFSNDMIRCREELQFSIASVSYKYLGIHPPKIPIVNLAPEQLQHLHDTDETKIMEAFFYK